RMLVGMIEARERRIELLAEIIREARTIARDEAVLASPPFADDVDGVVELGRADHRQEPRLQDLGDEAVALGTDGCLLVGGEGLRPYALPTPHSDPLRCSSGSISIEMQPDSHFPSERSLRK